MALPVTQGSRQARASRPAARITAWSIPLAPAAMKYSSNHFVRTAAYSLSIGSRAPITEESQPRLTAASTKGCAYLSVNSGQSQSDSAARAMATPSAVAPTLSVMSQLSSSVRTMTNVHFAFGAVLNAATTLSGKTQANEIANHPLGRRWAWCTSSAMSTDVTVDVNAGVAVLTLNRPEHLNAYTAEMGALLSAAYRDCDNDDNVRAIVITGAGRAFCAGADFSGSASPFDSPPDDSAFSASPPPPAAFELRKPVIAAVNGHAIGMGLTIALQADMRIVADDANYGVVQVRRGVVPDCMSHWTLAQLTSLGVAAEVLLTGRTFSGGEAVGWGIANRALPAAEVLDLATDIARDIATNVAPMSAALCKRLLWDSAINGYTPRQVASLETQLHHRVMGTDDAREGVTAFLERRAPRFSAQLSAEWAPLPEPEL